MVLKNWRCIHWAKVDRLAKKLTRGRASFTSKNARFAISGYINKTLIRNTVLVLIHTRLTRHEAEPGK
jgi:hypothetical protein